MTPEKIAEFVLEAAREQGCVCDVQIHVWVRGDDPDVEIFHADSCPLIRNLRAEIDAEGDA